MTTSLQEIREKFEKEYDGCCLGANQAQSDANKKDLANFWLSLIKERDAELASEINKLPTYQEKYPNGDIGNPKLEKSEVLALLTTTPTEGGEINIL